MDALTQKLEAMEAEKTELENQCDALTAQLKTQVCVCLIMYQPPGVIAPQTSLSILFKHSCVRASMLGLG